MVHNIYTLLGTLHNRQKYISLHTDQVFCVVVLGCEQRLCIQILEVLSLAYKEQLTIDEVSGGDFEIRLLVRGAIKNICYYFNRFTLV